MMAEIENSKLLPIVRDLHAAKAIWFNKYQETGELDETAFSAMCVARKHLHQSPPETVFDCLLLCGAIRSVARYGLLVTHENEQNDPARSAITELANASTALTQALEKLAGQSLDDLNLFNDGDALQ